MMLVMKETYGDFLKKQVALEKGYIRHLPDLYDVLVAVLPEDILDTMYRDVSSVLAYLVCPIDIVADDAYPDDGYVDDIYVCAYVVSKLLNTYPELVHKNWHSSEDVHVVVNWVIEHAGSRLDKLGVREKLLKMTRLL